MVIDNMSEKTKSNDDILVINNNKGSPESNTTLYLSNSDSIEKIGLSVRSHNALRRAGVHTIDEMLALDSEHLRKNRVFRIV